ncbi:nucleolus and neural progenitor protein [Linepithema humile]|uniref:nucleolus and neural progenitor protein n=1 Tax=Linepithema humile TaxID=83485 RepID=UPI0006237B10|nr:PREDICTED: uncharacterized protein LOC105669281 [Linepithema humile]
MDALWNVFNLEQPPCTTWHVKPLDAKTMAINVDLLNTVVATAIKDLKSLDVLHTEAAVLSRLIYRMKSKFRNDKGLKKMAQLNKALLNYYNMDLLKEYETLKSIIQTKGEIYILPSKQMLEYVLVRMQGFAKLMIRVDKIAKDAAHFLKARIQLGHAWTISLMAYATVSRIWIYSKLMLQKCCKWYEGLYRCSENFQLIGLPWIPKDQSLPCDLKLWLPDFDWLDNEMSFSHDGLWQQKNMFKLLKLQSDNTEEINLMTPDNFTTDISRLSQENTSTHDVPKNESTSRTDKDDTGEIIDRETFKRSLPKASHVAENSLARKHKETMEEPKNKKRKRETKSRIKFKSNRSKQ